jgi:hypothetical protein
MTDCGKGARGRKLFFTSFKYSSALILQQHSESAYAIFSIPPKSLGTVKSCFIIDFTVA